MNFLEFLENNKIHVENYFDDKIAECGTYTELPKELVNCRCCERHKKDFPSIGNPISGYKGKVRNENLECKCPCRHISRHICKEWDLLNEVEEISSSEFESSDSEESGSEDSMDDFIVEDSGLSKKERKELDSVLKKLRSKKSEDPRSQQLR